MRIRSWIMGMVLAGVVVSMAGAAGLEKRLILHSWDMKGPAYLAENAGRLQHAPFDGLVVRARGTLDGWDDTSRATNFCYTFYNKNVDVSAAEPLVEAMSKIKWGKFTDNFMYMVPGDNVDWFDEAAWDEKDGYILKNVRAIARMGSRGTTARRPAETRRASPSTARWCANAARSSSTPLKSTCRTRLS